MISFILLCSLLGIGLAGRAPYLGGDMEQYIQKSKKQQIAPRSNRPVTAKQLQDYKTYQSKFSDIAKAYSEGYKAAIQAVQTRAQIARQRVTAARSKIPGSPSATPQNIQKQVTRANIAVFRNPVPNIKIVTGIEKSGIPYPFTEAHKMVARSIYGQPEETHLNAAALNRNHYLDIVGIDSYGGNGIVLTKQNWTLKKKHRRRRRRSIDNTPDVITRHRRSRMPYLGQNLDQMGIKRVVPNWDDPSHKKTKIQTAFVGTPFQATPQQAFFKKQAANPYLRKNIPIQQIFIGNKFVNPFQQRSSISNPFARFQQQQPYLNPYTAGLTVPAPSQNTIETKKVDKEAAILRSKKSASPVPDNAAMNYAARHRNVYLDSISGDAYSGGSTILSKQYILKKH